MIAEYLMKNYYTHCPDKNLIPTQEQIDQAVSNHPDKMVIVKDGYIRGAAVFLTLTDETFKRLHMIDITRIDVIQALALENGRNIHFVLVCADGLKTVRIGLRRVIRNFKPKTISWWNPNFTYLHKYEMKGRLCRS